MQVYSVTVMTHVKALQAGHSSQGTSEPITPAPILNDQKTLLIAFLAISDQYATFFYKMAAGGHFGWPKITFDRISHHFRSIYNFDFFFHKMAAGGHFGWRKSLFIAFLGISDQYTTFFFFWFFHKIAAGGLFGWPKMTFEYYIFRHFRSIHNFYFFWFFFQISGI